LLGHPWPVGVLGDRDLEDLAACQLDEDRERMRARGRSCLR
jgi:hypothetical protein